MDVSTTCGSGWVDDERAILLENFEQHLHEACLGQVSEIFDGDAPHTPRGYVAQAWSVAELLRAIVEDIEQPHREAAKAG